MAAAGNNNRTAPSGNGGDNQGTSDCGASRTEEQFEVLDSFLAELPTEPFDWELTLLKQFAELLLANLTDEEGKDYPSSTPMTEVAK